MSILHKLFVTSINLARHRISQVDSHFYFSIYNNYNLDQGNWRSKGIGMEEPTVSLSVPVIPPSLIDEELKTEALTSISQTELEKPFVRLPKAQKKLLKAEKLKARMKFQSKEYLKRRKERRLEALAANPELNNQVKATKALIEGSFERLSNALTNGLKVCVDLSFEEIQDDRELSSLAKQLAVAYGFLKKQQKPVHLHVCGLVPSSSIYSKLQQQGFESWIISRHSELPWDIYPKSKIVIMSPDASEPLETVESDKVLVSLCCGGFLLTSKSRFMSSVE